MNILPSRRRFLQAGLATAAIIPAWYSDWCGGAEPQTKPATAPSEQFGIGLVGCGGMGTGDARNASASSPNKPGFGKIVAVCDVDESQLGKARKIWPGATPYHDFRKLMEQKNVDVVICGTVDHWHTLVSMAAMKAGKDVYCEKPLTLTIDEGKRLVEVQRQTKRILQTGTQQRSSSHFRLAVDMIRNNRIGKLKHIDVWLPAGLRAGPFAEAPVPEGFDYDMWQGQTPKVPYVKERTHRTFRYWWEYSAGTITDWGAHHNDIALWATGYDRLGPVAVEGKSLKEMIPGGYTAASEYEIHFTYENGVTHTCRSTTASAWNGAVVDKEGQLHGIKFTGSDGWLWVTRGQIAASDPEMLKQKLPESAPHVYVSNDHMGNFFECVKTRKAPICDVEIGHRSATMCHLGAIAVQLGRKLKWDPRAEQFVGDAEALKMMSREQRKPWTYDCV